MSAVSEGSRGNTASPIPAIGLAGLPIGRIDVEAGRSRFAITIDLPASGITRDGRPDCSGRLVVSSLLCDPDGRPPDVGSLHPRVLDALDALRPHLVARLALSPLRLTLDVGDIGTGHLPCFNRPVGTARPLVPDLYLLRSTPSPPEPTWPAFRDEFLERAPTLFWRGSTTGGRARSRDELLDNPRIRACIEIARVAARRSDCKIALIVQAGGFDLAAAEAELRRRGLMSDWVDEATFRQHRMTIDLPGNAAAWGTCRKYLAGCLVLRPPQTYELIYSDRLKPWEHLVPLRGDLADLDERLAWAATRPHEAAAIAWRGRTLLSDVARELPELMQTILRTHGACAADG